MADFDNITTQIDALNRAEEILLSLSAMYALGTQLMEIYSVYLTPVNGEDVLINTLYTSTEWTSIFGMMNDFIGWRSGRGAGFWEFSDLSTIVIDGYQESRQRIGVMQRAQNIIPQFISANQTMLRLVELRALYIAGTDAEFNTMVDTLYDDQWTYVDSLIEGIEDVTEYWTTGTGTGGMASIDILALEL